jgi:hypothetical protein
METSPILWKTRTKLVQNKALTRKIRKSQGEDKEKTYWDFQTIALLQVADKIALISGRILP